MKRALRYPSRWAGWWRTLGITAVLSVALGALFDTSMAPAKAPSNIPAPAPAPTPSPIYVVKDKDTVESVSQRYGVPVQTIVDRNRLQQPYTLRPGQSLELPGARFVPMPPAVPRPRATGARTGQARGLPPPAQGEPPRSAAPAAAGQPTPLSPAAADPSVTVPATPPPPRLPGRSRARSWRPTAPPPAARRTTASTSRPRPARR